MDKLDGDATPVQNDRNLKILNIETPSEITEDIFADNNHFYVEMLDDNYHYADIIGFPLVNEKGHFLLTN